MHQGNNEAASVYNFLHNSRMIRHKIAFSRWQRCLLSGLLLALAGNLHAQDEATERLHAFLDGLDTYTAAFEQTLFNGMGEALETSSGTVHLEQPGRFRWEYREPYSQYLISDGSTLWIYDQDLEQVTINNIDATAADSPAAVLTGEIEIEKEYIVTGMDTGGSLAWIELVPRRPDTQFNTLRMGFDGSELAEMIMLDSFEQKTLIRFSDARRNVPLDDSLFEFEVPADADVIDSRE